MLRCFQKRTWAEIDLAAVRENFNVIKNCLENKTKICCVVKANAYGHGAVQLSRIYEELGADYFAVSNIEEALQLRQGGISTPILVLGYTDPCCSYLLAINNISQCVFSKSYAKKLSDEIQKHGRYLKIHIKVDTGMGRIGFDCRDRNSFEIDEIVDSCGYDGLIPEGIFTHFASADEDEVGEDYTKHQFSLFMSVIKVLMKRGLNFSIKHCANSAAIFRYKNMHLNMVRAGIVLYGLEPSRCLKMDGKIRQVMTLYSVVNHIKKVKKGQSLGYGRTFVAKDDMVVATVSVGYADGLLKPRVEDVFFEIEGVFVPVIGRICMDQCMVDITKIDNVNIGSKVVVYGRNGKNSIDCFAHAGNVINYQIICALGERVPRIYV